MDTNPPPSLPSLSFLLLTDRRPVVGTRETILSQGGRGEEGSVFRREGVLLSTCVEADGKQHALGETKQETSHLLARLL